MWGGDERENWEQSGLEGGKRSLGVRSSVGEKMISSGGEEI